MAWQVRQSARYARSGKMKCPDIHLVLSFLGPSFRLLSVLPPPVPKRTRRRTPRTVHTKGRTSLRSPWILGPWALRGFVQGSVTNICHLVRGCLLVGGGAASRLHGPTAGSLDLLLSPAHQNMARHVPRPRAKVSLTLRPRTTTASNSVYKISATRRGMGDSSSRIRLPLTLRATPPEYRS